MNKALFTWLGGLISACSGAVGAAVGVIVVDPADFNFQAGHAKLFTVSGISAAVAFLNYLAKSPLPGWTSTTTTVTEERAPHITTITTPDGTVEERSPHTTTMTKTEVVQKVEPPVAS